MQAFLRDLVASDFVTDLGEYDTDRFAENGEPGTQQHIGTGAYLGAFTIAPSPARNASTITDDDVQVELTAQIDAGALPPPAVDAAGHTSTAYVVFLRSDQRVCDGVSCSLEPNGFCAYHSTFRLHGDGPVVLYSVHPDLTGFADRACGPGDDLSVTTATLSHELAEVITDPLVGLATVLAPPVAWYDANESGLGEVADVCERDHVPLTLGGVTYTVQRLWSNALGACVTMGAQPRATGAPGGAQASALDVGAPLVRLLDTRTGAALGPGEVRRVGTMLPGATAAVLNVVSTEATAGGYLTVWPCGAPRPLASAVANQPGRTAANLVTVALGADGDACVFNSAGHVHVVVDRLGAFAPAGGGATRAGRYVPLRSVRALDTRLTGAPFAAGESRTIDLTNATVPADARAVALTVTAVDAPADGHWSVWPSGPWPGTSNVNVAAGRTAANQVVVRAERGAAQLRSHAGGHVIVDVDGYFTGDAAPMGVRGLFHATTPTRVLDTRERGPAGYGGAALVEPNVPSIATAASLTVTVTGSTDAGFLTVFPAAPIAPLASSANYGAREPVAGHALVGLAGGRVGLRTNVTAHLVVDVTGWFS